MKKFGFLRSSDNQFRLLLLLICSTAFGILVPFLGFYWDDFAYLYHIYRNGPIGVFRAIALDRPLLGTLYILPTAILGFTPFVWQIFAVIARWLFSISVYEFLKELWPDNAWVNKIIVILFLAYPGFSQQWISVIYSHIFIIFALYFLSLILQQRAIQRKSNLSFLTVVFSVLISLFCMASVEYVVGLEILRPLIIYKIFKSRYVKSTNGEIIRKSILVWIPYLISDLVFIIYRLFFAQSVVYEQQIFSSSIINSISNLIRILTRQFQNAIVALFGGWSKLFQSLVTMNFNSRISLVYLGLIIFYTIFAFIFMMRIGRREEKLPDPNWQKEVMIGSVLILLVVGIPFSAVNLNLSAQFPSDRIYLPYMLAASSLIISILQWILKKQKTLIPILSLLIGLSTAYQFYVADTYRKDWILLQDFFQQLSWRVPSLEKNTLILAEDLPLRYYSDNSLTAPLNWIFGSEEGENELQYLIAFTDVRLGNSLKSLEPGQIILHNYRTLTFQGSTDDSLFLYFNPPGCVHIIDPDLDRYNPLVSDEIRFDLDISDLNLIKPDFVQNEVFFLESIPDKSWCYFFQKASLAAQNKEWDEVVQLGKKAFALNDYPNDASERIPFLEANAMTGNISWAIEQSETIHEISPAYDDMLCVVWERIMKNIKISGSMEESKSRLNTLINCK